MMITGYQANIIEASGAEARKNSKQTGVKVRKVTAANDKRVSRLNKYLERTINGR